MRIVRDHITLTELTELAEERFGDMINLRPHQQNRSRSVDDPAIRARIAAVVDRIVIQ